MAAPRAPRNLGAAGKRLWKSITEEYDLSSAEYMHLENAAREADLIEKLEDFLQDAPLTVTGSMGQEVAHPMITELRQHRVAQSNILAKIRFPAHPEEGENGVETAEEDGPKKPMSRTESARKAAAARWGT